jgi:hypothetical protein
MAKVIQIATTSGAGWHTLTVLYDDGQVYERDSIAGRPPEGFRRIALPRPMGPTVEQLAKQGKSNA